ncbi:MAG: helix-hairpin-helix domain-containing protein [Bacteroidales bacterium]|nr:helix-hairpin-helix domain-containing protein [Bacteroidales bacterium]
MRREKKEQVSKGAASGMVALVFLILGFQLAIFVVKIIERPGEARSDPGMPELSEPDPSVSRDENTVIQQESGSPERTKFGGYARPDRNTARKPAGGSIHRPVRQYESFPFNPNTVTLDELQRLGLSQRQAESIDNYRSKGGRFRSKADFQNMYVVSDTLFARLEPYIEIPKLELNTADSAALVSLHGIGPWYARKILDYRDRLGGYYDKNQLLEIDGLDAARYEGFADDITVDPGRIHRLDLWHASDSLLIRHPYLGPRGARSVLRYRQLYDSTRWTLTDLAHEQVLPQENIEKLKKYIEIQ